MKRRLLNFLTALSLLLCMAIAALWVRSYWRADCVMVWNSRGELSVAMREGHLLFQASNLYGDGPGAYLLVRHVDQLNTEIRMRPGVVHDVLGFIYGRDTDPGFLIRIDSELTRHGLRVPEDTVVLEYWVVPFWAVCGLAALPPALLLRRRHVLRRRRSAGLCPVCGYNLTGNVSGVCPECGMAP